MPEESGVRMFRDVQGDPDTASIPVIMITGAPSVDTATESLRIGAFDYIVKPIRQDALLRAVNVALKHKAVKEESEQCRLNFEAIFRSVNDGIITVDENMVVEDEVIKEKCDDEDPAFEKVRAFTSRAIGEGVSSTRSRPCRMAIQRSGRRFSAGVLRLIEGTTSSSSRSKSG